MDQATHMEAQLRGLSKASDKDGDWFKLILWVHPEDFPDELFKVPLRSRLGVAMVQIADDETEKPVEKRKFEDLPPSQQAGIRCNDPQFQAWCQEVATTTGWPWPASPGDQAAAAGRWVREQCGVVSRSELNEGEPFKKWLHLQAEFETDTRLPERR